ncbi:MAG: hypothetical protein IKZ81_08155, partial [Clostridia bacterium]|nr:hypothetical protein [Clostridia bacterium]
MSENGYKFNEVFTELTQASDKVKDIRIKNASVRKDDNVLSLNIRESVSADTETELKQLLTSAYGFSDVVVECESPAEPEISAEAPAPVTEQLSEEAESVPEPVSEAVSEQPEPSENTDEYAFAEILNKAISMSPPVASLLAGCKYALDGSVATLTLAKGGKSYLDVRGVTAFFEKQLRAATNKPYVIEYDGLTELEKDVSDQEIIELSTVNSDNVAKEKERVLLGNKITKQV